MNELSSIDEVLTKFIHFTKKKNQLYHRQSIAKDNKLFNLFMIRIDSNGEK